MNKYGESMELYYELSVNKLTFISAFPNRNFSITDFFSLGFGARWHW